MVKKQIFLIIAICLTSIPIAYGLTFNYIPIKGNTPINGGFEFLWDFPEDNKEMRCFTIDGLQGMTIESIQGNISTYFEPGQNQTGDNQISFRMSLTKDIVNSELNTRTSSMPCKFQNGTLVTRNYIESSGIRIMNGFQYLEPDTTNLDVHYQNIDIYVPEDRYLTIWVYDGGDPIVGEVKTYSGMMIYAKP